ncbi:unnamed protein product [Miscanthus lutarioriparius]|uniref:Response regulatory domain-containing protein n=1 Tax=Miscanthus lutarioriparius TaxID=422564 RepID=A0A811S9I1_9POAL|nr:unnamed protein product [Miscanthus lutarioriparius]
MAGVIGTTTPMVNEQATLAPFNFGSNRSSTVMPVNNFATVLSTNDEMETMVKAIKHGACDYMVKPVCPEKVRNIWMHVVRKSKSNPRNKVSGESDNPCQMVQYVDDENGEKDHAKHTRKIGRRTKKMEMVLKR